MRRVVSVWLPTWPTDRLRRQRDQSAPSPDKPLVTAIHDVRRRIVAAVDLTATQLGLTPGMPLAHARALIGDLDVCDGEPMADLGALRRLALWCLRYAPLVAADPPDGLWLDATGCAHLFAGETAMLTDLVDRLGRNGIAARSAIADTPGAAHALARFGGPAAVQLVEAGHTRRALEGLPIRALRLQAQIVEGLHRSGFERIGQLLVTPRAPLVLRFGLTIAQRIDQALGLLFEPIEPAFPQEAVRHRLAFAEPIATPRALAGVIGDLSVRVCATLEQTSRGARRLDLLFERVDGSYQAIRAGTARPSRDAGHLGRLLIERLETIDPGFGIEAMTLTVPLAEPLAYAPVGSLLDAQRSDQDLATLVNRLGNRFGASRLYRAAPAESDIPERSVERIPPLAPPRGTNWSPALPRPNRLLSPPEPIETIALLPDHPPAAFVWRGMRRLVRRLDGPETVYGEWWRAEQETESVRDYFQVEDDAGSRFWLFRAGLSNAAAWFIHGLFG